ncbi:uncharacterized [Tachysurus ichikawai]
MRVSGRRPALLATPLLPSESRPPLCLVPHLPFHFPSEASGSRDKRALLGATGHAGGRLEQSLFKKSSI